MYPCCDQVIVLPNPCASSNSCDRNYDSHCVIVGTALPCLGIGANTPLDVVLQTLCQGSLCTPVTGTPDKIVASNMVNPSVNGGGCSGYQIDIAPVFVTQVNTNTTNINQIITDLNGLTTIKVSLSSSQILTLNTNPVLMVSAPGVGKALINISAIARLNFGTTPYASYDQIVLYTNGTNAAYGVAASSYIVSSSISKIDDLVPQGPHAGTSMYAENEPLYLRVNTGNPTGGDSTLDIYITYQTITL